VVGDSDVTVKMMVVGISDSVTTTVDNCVVIRVCVRVTASVTVVAVAASPPELPPSTATTEYEAGSRRLISVGKSGRALATSRNEDSDSEEYMYVDFISKEGDDLCVSFSLADRSL
jgi:hypothetical protein